MTEFDDIPTHDNRKTLSREVLDLDGLTACREVWCEQIFAGESIFFRRADVEGMTEDAIKKMAQSNRKGLRSGHVTLQRSGDYVVCSVLFGSVVNLKLTGGKD